MTDIVERLKQAGCHYGIPMERDCAVAADTISQLREALETLKKQSMTLRGEQSYREFPKFVRRVADDALKAAQI